MSIAAAKSLENPEETRRFPHGHVDLVTLGGTTAGRAEFEPGWRWSNDVAPIAGTKSCQAMHTGYVLSGRMHIRMDDGTEADVGPGDAMVVEPGHDAWTVGDESCVVLDFTGLENYAKQ
ncbi:cupin domain-containing protein [Saccharothrix variisporea]|uniref:Cupin domain n=1 Tax=Saccharothrix variisporea TaxID=543527 RepID=A0A495X2T0_9PSEU|nr:cupin domain-containing protein [Saccharothrix variisporea]RKT67555.1 cupin domain [Saccharothrix variisporea]